MEIIERGNADTTLIMCNTCNSKLRYRQADIIFDTQKDEKHLHCPVCYADIVLKESPHNSVSTHAEYECTHTFESIASNRGYECKFTILKGTVWTISVIKEDSVIMNRNDNLVVAEVSTRYFNEYMEVV
jgi:hypothetical protein